MLAARPASAKHSSLRVQRVIVDHGKFQLWLVVGAWHVMHVQKQRSQC